MNNDIHHTKLTDEFKSDVPYRVNLGISPLNGDVIHWDFQKNAQRFRLKNPSLNPSILLERVDADSPTLKVILEHASRHRKDIRVILHGSTEEMNIIETEDSLPLPYEFIDPYDSRDFSFLDKVNKIMSERATYLETNNLNSGSVDASVMKSILVVMEINNEILFDKKKMEQIVHMLRLGRIFHVHVVLKSSDNSSKYIPGEMSANIPIKVSHDNNKAQLDEKEGSYGTYTTILEKNGIAEPMTPFFIPAT